MEKMKILLSAYDKYKKDSELFKKSKIPNPTNNQWDDWKKNLTNTKYNNLIDNEKICFINTKNQYGTRSSALIGIPNKEKINESIVFISTKNYPNINNYMNVKI